MLQFPVYKAVADEFNRMSKAINVSKGDFFTIMFADFVEKIKTKVDENIKNKKA